MGNESGKEEKQEETNINNPEQTQKDEIPADTQENDRYIESPKQEGQGPNHIIIKENNYENNEDGVHTKVNERRVEYHISKVNKEYDENAENAENVEYDENVEQFEDNAEGEYEINQQEQQEEIANEGANEGEGYEINRQYATQEIYGKENQNINIENYPYNYTNSNVVINKSNSTGAAYGNSNIKVIRDEKTNNILIETGGYARHTSSYYSDIPRYMSFQKAELKGTGNIRSSLNVVKTEDTSELVEIPKSEYPSYAGRETVFIGGGMETGEYKFKGQGIVITQKGALEENIEINEEEILKEINRRKNKPKKEKRKKYEILDKFYAITEYEGKAIIKTEKMEQLQKQYEFNQQQKISASGKGSASFQMNASASNNINDSGNAQFQQMQFSQYQQQSHSQSQSESNINNASMNYLLKYKNLDASMQPGDNFSKSIFNQINKIRENPQSYIKVIEDAKKNITIDKRGRLIYNGSIKIALSRGEEAFDEAITFLKSLNPLDKLIFNPYLVAEMPKKENEIRFKNDLRYKVESMINKGIIVKSFWRDVIRDPELSLLMMIVDDIGEMSGMRRRDLLDPNMKYIGISSVEINESFVCYFILCTKE